MGSSLSRREFLRLGGGAVLGATLSEFIPLWVQEALAGPPVGPNMVLLRTFGGMDTTLGLDPLVMPADCTDQDVFIEYRPDEIQQKGGLKFGPAAVDLLPYAQHCCVVNGLMMRRDAGHDVINLYMASGRGDGKAGHLPAEISLATRPGPFGVLTNGGLYTAAKPVLVSTTKELKEVASGAELAALIEQKVKDALPSGTPLEAAEKAVLEAQQKAVVVTETLENLAKEFGTLQETHILLAGLLTGAVRHGLLNLTPNVFLDTHVNHEGNHLRGQRGIWKSVADFLGLLESKGLLANTLVMVVTEFSRTPNLNTARGKDHNPFTNSVLLAGGGVRGGVTVGQSRIIPRNKSKTGEPLHYAVPFDYAEGKPATSPQGASFLYPENLIRTLMGLYNDPVNFNAVSYSLPKIPGIVF